MNEITPASVDITEHDAPPSPVRIRRRHHHSRRPSWLHRQRKRISRLKWTKVLLVAASAVAVAAVAVAAVVGTTTSRVENSLANLGRIMSDLQNRQGTDLTLTDFNRLEAGVNEVSGAVAQARRLTGLAAPILRTSPDLAATSDILDASYALTLAGKSMLTGLQPALFYLVDGQEDQAVVTQISSGERIIELLRLGRGQFLSAQASLESARAQLDALNLNTISPDRILNVVEAQRYLTQLEQINQVLIDSPDLLTLALGMGEETDYLVLAQNNDELRPSGGYLSTWGWLTFRNGRVTDYSFGPTTTTSPNPPATVLEGAEVPDWWIGYSEPVYAAWDGSWYADFPSTAALAIRYYNEGDNPRAPVDGAISIDIVGFEYILEALGSVTLPTYDLVVTPEKFREAVYDIRAFGEGELPHKRFIAALYRQILTDWENATDPAVSSQLVGALLRGLQEKHIMISFSERRLNEAITLLGWSGAQVPGTDHDYLLVADANLGNKSNRSILRQITYDAVLLADRTVSGALSITYDYSEQVAASDPAVDEAYHGPLDYNNLLQIFLPRGTTLTDFAGFPAQPLVVDTSTHTILVSQVQIPFDSTERFEASYRLPAVIEDLGPYAHYRLLIQKQPGTLAQSASVQLRLPAGAELISSSPEPAARYILEQPIMEFDITLDSDQWIEVIYSVSAASAQD